MLLSEEAKKLDKELDEAIKESGPNLNKGVADAMAGKSGHVAKTYRDYAMESEESRILNVELDKAIKG